MFYIGVTGNLATRYKAHMNQPCVTSKVGNHIRDMISKGKVIRLYVIDHLPTHEALEKEKHIINTLTKAGHNLLNEQHKYFVLDRPQDHWSNKTQRQIIKSLKNIQYTLEEYYCCINRLNYEQTTGNKRVNPR